MSFKVVTVPDGVTANAGASPKDMDGPLGLEEPAAQADAQRRNAKAEELGLETRYEVVELES